MRNKRYSKWPWNNTKRDFPIWPSEGDTRVVHKFAWWPVKEYRFPSWVDDRIPRNIQGRWLWLKPYVEMYVCPPITPFLLMSRSYPWLLLWRVAKHRKP